MSLILCGLPMSGKTTLGKLLAKRLGRHFIDTDSLIESAYFSLSGRNYSCREIYSNEGQSFFRLLEKQQIMQLVLDENRVISLGGGTLMDPSNAVHLQHLGCLIYLKTHLKTILNRLIENKLPPYLTTVDPKTGFYAFAKKRIPIYEKYADQILNTESLSIDEAVEHLTDLLRKKEFNGK